jgi:hypothetical protein
VALLLGRYWPYMTPAYIWGEMDMGEVSTALGYVMRWELHPVNKKHYDALVKGLEEWLTDPPARQDLSWLKEPIGKVIRKHG